MSDKTDIYAQLGVSAYAAANIYFITDNIIEYFKSRGARDWVVIGIHRFDWEPTQPNRLLESHAPPLMRWWARLTGRFIKV